MRGWYRALVALVALAAAFCMVSFACVCANLWSTGPENALNGRFSWTNGVYRVEGEAERGALLHMTVDRLQLAQKSE